MRSSSTQATTLKSPFAFPGISCGVERLQAVVPNWGGWSHRGRIRLRTKSKPMLAGVGPVAPILDVQQHQ